MTTNIRRRTMKLNTDMQNTYDPLLLSKQTGTKTTAFERLFLEQDKIKWHWAPAFLIFWLLLYCWFAIPAYHSLPQPLSIKDEAMHPETFIAEHAEVNLQKLIALGPRVVGSAANEQGAIKYFMDFVQNLKAEASPLYNIEADVQIASGSYVHWEMVNMYQSIQNFVIKISSKSSNSSACLLVNSHFDSVPLGPGAGDDGTMVAVMLETLRVLSQSKKPLIHPVIFLFNGAEENPLQASHAFITQHKWAGDIKALINLDSAGSGGKEILFQSGPNHPWLMQLYKNAAKHPYASTVAEEMFQRHLIPSDTDFRIFRDHGRVPGLDMAHQYNGYVYHTRFDRPEIIPRATFQSTGDNVLALVREFGNSSILPDTLDYAEGHTVFFDFMGLFLVFYTEKEGIILNFFVSIAAFLTCGYSLHVMASDTGLKFNSILKRTFKTFGVQALAVLVGIACCFFVGILMDLLHMPMSWFTNSWLILGLYFCSLFFGYAIIPAMYLQNTRDDRLPLGFRVQLQLHCHCLFLAFVTLILTVSGIRSAFMLMLAVMFYTTGLIINLGIKLHSRPIAWIIPHIICGIPPFLFYAYMSHGSFVAFIPMTGRFGSNVNPDLIMCAFTVGIGLLAGGFMIPLLHLFTKPKTIISILLAITVIFIVLAATPVGFPYRPETNVQRFTVLHTKRVFHDDNNSVRRTESGYFILPQDRRTYSVKNKVLNMTLAQNILSDCDNEMFCGLPLYNHRWQKSRATGIWIPGPEPRYDQTPKVQLVNKTQISKKKVRYEFTLTGPDHMALFIKPLGDANIKEWSFHYTPLRLNWSPPYFIYFSYGINGAALRFWIEVERPSGKWKDSSLELGISGHWTHHEYIWTDDFNKFLKSFPKYVDPISWPAYYETRFFQ